MLSLLPVLNEVLQKSNVASPVVSVVSTILNFLGMDFSLLSLLIFLVAAVIFKSAIQFAALSRAGFEVSAVTQRLRSSLVSTLAEARWGYFDKVASGHLTNAVGSEASRASAAYLNAIQTFSIAVQAFCYLLAVVLVSWRVAFAGLIVSASIALVLKQFLKSARAAGEIQTQSVKDMTTCFADVLSNMKPLKAMGLDYLLKERLAPHIHRLQAADRRQSMASEGLRAAQEPILALLVAVGLYLSVIESKVPLPDVMVTMILFYRLLNRIHLFQQSYQSVLLTQSAYWELEKTIGIASQSRDNWVGRNSLTPHHITEFELVGFEYAGHPILALLNLRIPDRSFVLIVGESGSGKTTLIDLLCGLRQPTSGRILVDGEDLQTIKHQAWSESIGYLPQEPVLIQGTILENVLLASKEIKRAQAIAALARAGAMSFIDSLPLGLQTLVGERGLILSGGQRQRVALARALVRDPSMLILDEPTTAVDPETEKSMCDVFRHLKQSTTIVAISHQRALQDVADVIYMLENGMLTQIK